MAFYGGSFSALPVARQVELLAAVRPYLEQGLVREIRLSTRPDAIDRTRLDLLAQYQVKTIELGAQSCDDTVLRQSRRGHSAADISTAARLIQERGFHLGIQLMLGLPGQNWRSLRQTVAEVIALRPHCVRLYPLLVVRGSELESLYQQGAYRPLSLGRAVVLTAAMKKRFDAAGIRVLRMGLQASESLSQSLVAGPYHPAFGELVHARFMLSQTRRLLMNVSEQEPVSLVIAERDQSVFRGIGGANIKRLRQLGLLARFTLATDPKQVRLTMRVNPGH